MLLRQVFVLSTGSDPMDAVFALGRAMGDVRITTVSLGQGQNIKAERLLKKCSQNGSWLVLQNCHLYPSWMTTLNQLFKDLTRRSLLTATNSLSEGEEPVDVNFRLWYVLFLSCDVCGCVWMRVDACGCVWMRVGCTFCPGGATIQYRFTLSKIHALDHVESRIHRNRKHHVCCVLIPAWPLHDQF
jgi:hypothetical protein